MDECGPKHVAADVLLHYCDSHEVSACVGLHCDHWIITHRKEKVKSSSFYKRIPPPPPQ